MGLANERDSHYETTGLAISLAAQEDIIDIACKTFLGR